MSDQKPGTELVWTKSSFSFANGDCVEVALLPGGRIGVRDSEHPDDGMLSFPLASWHAFISGVHKGDFNHTLKSRS